jgi:hypothetical protein
MDTITLTGQGLPEPLNREEALASLREAARRVPLTHWAGMCLHPEDVAAALGVDLSTVEGWMAQNEVIGIQHEGEPHLPMRQFLGAAPMAGLKHILDDALGNPSVAWHWLMTPHHECDGRPPIELMREGHGEKVLELSTRSLAPPDFCLR